MEKVFPRENIIHPCQQNGVTLDIFHTLPEQIPWAHCGPSESQAGYDLDGLANFMLIRFSALLLCMGLAQVRSRWDLNGLRERSLSMAGGGRCKSENRMHQKFAPLRIRKLFSRCFRRDLKCLCTKMLPPLKACTKILPPPQFACTKIFAPAYLHRPPAVNNDHSLT